MVNKYIIIFLIKPSGLFFRTFFRFSSLKLVDCFFRTFFRFSSLKLVDCFLEHFVLDFID